MGPDFLQPLQVFTKFALHAVCQNLCILAICDITLSVEEPCRDLVLSWVLNDCDNSLKLFRCDLTSTEIFDQLRPSSNILAPLTYRLFRSTSAFLQTKLE